VTLAEHFEEIREAKRRGIYVSIQVNPVVAGIVTHDDVEALFELLRGAGADHVIVKFVEASFPWAGTLVDKVTRSFGANRAAAFRDLFVENSAGQQRTVAEAYRVEGHARYQKKATALGLTYATCFEYSRTGPSSFRSIGQDWITADTCHGHRVPFFVRADPQSPFRALGSCPPSGCLHCGDDNAGQPRCGSALLGAAKALQIVDLRKNPGVTHA
jgi:hypothetical protein